MERMKVLHLTIEIVVPKTMTRTREIKDEKIANVMIEAEAVVKEIAVLEKTAPRSRNSKKVKTMIDEEGTTTIEEYTTIDEEVKTTRCIEEIPMEEEVIEAATILVETCIREEAGVARGMVHLLWTCHLLDVGAVLGLVVVLLDTGTMDLVDLVVVDHHFGATSETEVLCETVLDQTVMIVDAVAQALGVVGNMVAETRSVGRCIKLTTYSYSLSSKSNLVDH